MEGVKGASQCVEGNTSYWRGLGPEATEPRNDKRVADSRCLGGLTRREERRRALRPSASGPPPPPWRASAAATTPPSAGDRRPCRLQSGARPQATGMMRPLAAG